MEREFPDLNSSDLREKTEEGSDFEADADSVGGGFGGIRGVGGKHGDFGIVREKVAHFSGSSVIGSKCDLRFTEEKKSDTTVIEEKRIRRSSNQETTSKAQKEVQQLRENMKR